MWIPANRLTRLTIIVGMLFASGRQMSVAAAQESAGAERERGIAEVTTRFADTLNLARTEGPTTPLRVELKEWHLAGQSQLIELRVQGFYVAQLVWGNVTTQIVGASTARKPGDFWSVDKNVPMVVTIKKPGEEALIQTFSVNPGH